MKQGAEEQPVKDAFTKLYYLRGEGPHISSILHLADGMLFLTQCLKNFVVILYQQHKIFDYIYICKVLLYYVFLENITMVS